MTAESPGEYRVLGPYLLQGTNVGVGVTATKSDDYDNEALELEISTDGTTYSWSVLVQPGQEFWLKLKTPEQGETLYAGLVVGWGSVSEFSVTTSVSDDNAGDGDDTGTGDDTRTGDDTGTGDDPGTGDSPNVQSPSFRFGGGPLSPWMLAALLPLALRRKHLAG